MDKILGMSRKRCRLKAVVLSIVWVCAVIMASPKVYSGNKTTSEELHQEGIAFMQKGQYIRAEAKFVEAYKHFPKVSSLEAMALAQRNQKKYAEALKNYKLLKKKFGRKLKKQDSLRIAEDIKLLEKLLFDKNDEEAGQKQFEKGLALFREGQFEAAVIIFEQAYALNKDYKYLEYIAKAETVLQNYDTAIKTYKTFLRLGGLTITPGDVQIIEDEIRRMKNNIRVTNQYAVARDIFGKGYAFFTEGQFERAVIEFRKAYEVNPNAKTLFFLASSEMGRSNYYEALKLLKQCLANFGDTMNEERKRQVKENIVKSEEQIEDLNKYKKADEKIARGVKYCEIEKYKKAAFEFESAYELYPDWRYLWYIGKTNQLLGNATEAQRAYKNYRDFGGNEIPAQKQEQLKEEIENLRQVIVQEKATRLALTYFNQGVIFYERGKFEEASEQFELAYNINDSYKILHWIARNEVALQNYKRAIGTYTRYLHLGKTRIRNRQRQSVKAEIKRLRNLTKQKGNSPQ